VDDNKWVKNEFKTVGIRNERLVNRLENIISKLTENAECSMPQAFENPKDIKALYRFLENDNAEAIEILNAHKRQTIERTNGHDTILLIQDTTSLNYKKAARIKGMGIAGTHDNSKGLIMHTTLAFSTEGIPLGTLSEDIWTRNPNEKGNKSCKNGRNNSHKFETSDKESIKWINGFHNSIQGVSKDIRAVTICDREADMYKLFYEIILNKRDFVIRIGGKKRRISGEAKLLDNEIVNKTVDGQITVQVPRNTKSKIPPRDATLNIKYFPVTIFAPSNKVEFKGMPPLNLYTVLAEEINVPAGLEPIKWLLMTNIPVITVEEAYEKIKWYKHRWKIERFHHILKSGCQIEKLHMEDIEDLKKAIAMYTVVAWRLSWLTYMSRIKPDVTCENALSRDEWQALYCVINNTNKTCEKPPSLKDALIMIAKLGGFMARKSDGDPGVKVIWRGLRKLSNIMIGWNIAKMLSSPIVVGTD
jgi:hypothetical protein